MVSYTWGILNEFLEKESYSDFKQKFSSISSDYNIPELNMGFIPSTKK